MEGTQGFVNLGSLTWTYDSSNTRFIAAIPDIKNIGTRLLHMICSNTDYTCLYHGETYDSSWNKVYYNAAYSGALGIMIHDMSYNNADAFKNAMNGVYLVYELATPITPSYTDEQWDALLNSFKSSSATLTFGTTVYGGQVDFKTGRVVSEWGYIASYNGETLPSEWISDRDAYEAGTTPTTGAEVAYKLATPTELTLTPAQLEMLKGYNYLSGDGTITITAYVKTT